MKKVLVLVATVTVVFVLASSSFAQGRAKTGPDPSVIRDLELEKDSLHNLEVARHYFKQKKAYLAALRRCEEIDASNPNFARMDEVLYIAGESSLRLAETGGKQKTKETMPNDLQAREQQSKENPESKNKTPDELRQDARVYLSRLVHGYPESVFRKQAEVDLEPLGGLIQPSAMPED
jgi:outer membrane protein assembly factor BamD (BamD/ComL family)